MILSLDAGTTSMRGILFDDSGNGKFKSRYSISPQFLDALRVEQNPLVWRSALMEILKDCSKYSEQNAVSIDGITLTSFRSPVFPSDKNGNPLLPAIMWQDKRTDPLCEELAKESNRIYESTGLPLTSIFSAVKMLWIYKNHPELSSKIDKMAGIYDYIMFLLTGKFITDQSVASRFNLYNLSEREWDNDLLKLFSVKKNHLPRVYPPGKICGALKKETADETNLKQGTPIITGGGDQQCAALGLGITKPGDIAVNTGTGAYLISITDKPLPNPVENIFNSIAAVPGKYILEANLLTAGTIYRWFSETFMDSSMKETNRFSNLDKEIAQSPAGANGVILIPNFKESSSTSKGKGAFLNLDLNTTRGDMARAVLEGIAMEIREKLDNFEKLNGAIHKISVSGGMTRFAVYNQIQADIFNKEIKARGEGEATATGAWINGMIGLGKASSYENLLKNISREKETSYRPNRKNSMIYEKLEQQKRNFNFKNC